MINLSNFKPVSFDRTLSLSEYGVTKDPSFKIPDIVKESFLDAERERKELYARVEKEVQARLTADLEEKRKLAYDEGFEQGKFDSLKQQEDSRNKFFLENKDNLQKILQDLNDQKNEIFKTNMNFFFELLGEICKKVIGKHINYDQEALGRWLVDLCDELSKSEELTIHTSEKLKNSLETSMNYLKEHRTKFPNINIVVNQDQDILVVESKKVDIVSNFNDQIDKIVKLIEYTDAHT